jgi:hypothetical protein
MAISSLYVVVFFCRCRNTFPGDLFSTAFYSSVFVPGFPHSGGATQYFDFQEQFV